MKKKNDKVIYRLVKSVVHRPSAVISSPRLSSFSSVKYRFVAKQVSKQCSTLNKKTQTHRSKYETGVDVLFDATLCNQQNCQNNTQNHAHGYEELKDDLFEEIKPVNWKLQKLEKNFLLKYLESSLHRNDKHPCQKFWMTTRHRNYFSNEYHHLQEKPSVTSDANGMKRRLKTSLQMTTLKDRYTQTEQEGMDIRRSSNHHLQKWIRSSLIMVRAVDDALRDNDIKPIQDLNAGEMDKFHNLLKELYGGKKISDFPEDDPFFEFARNSFQKPETDKEVNDQLEQDFEEIMVERKVMIPDIQIVEPSTKLKSKKSKKKTDKVKKNGTKSEPKEESVIPTITEILTRESANTKLEEIKNASLRLSENYVDNAVGFQRPAIEKVCEEFVVYKSTFETEELEQKRVSETQVDLDSLKETKDDNTYVEFVDLQKDENRTDIVDENNSKDAMANQYVVIAKCIEGFLEEGPKNMKRLFFNKRRFHTILVLVSEALEKSSFKVPFIDNVGLVFSRSMSSLQTDARLAKSSVLNSFADDILKECNTICKYVGLDALSEATLGELFESIKHLIDEVSTTFEGQVLKIVEDVSVLKDFVLLVQYLVGNFDSILLGKYFSSQYETLYSDQIESLSHSNNDDSEGVHVSEILEDFEMLSNTLAIIQIWHQNNQGQSRNVLENGSFNADISNLVSDNYSLAITYNSDDVRTDMEKVKQWVCNLSGQTSKKKNIDQIFQKFVLTVEATKIAKLREVFKNPRLLNQLIKEMPLSPEICIKSSEICKLYNRLTSEDNTVRLEEIGRSKIVCEILTKPELIRQFMSVVSYLNVNDDSGKGFVLKSDQELIKENLEESVASILIKLYKMSNWLSLLETHCIFSELEHEPATSKIIKLSQIKRVLENTDLNPLIKSIFNDSQYLSEAIGAVRDSVSLQTSKNHSTLYFHDTPLSKSEMMIVNQKSLDFGFSVTEPVLESLEISDPKGKNRRFSNSEAQKLDLTSEPDQESTSQNVTSIANARRISEREESEKTEHLSLEIENMDIGKKSSDDYHLHIPSDHLKVTAKVSKEATLSQNDVELIIQRPTSRSDDTKKSFNLDDAVKCVPKISKTNSDRNVSLKSNSIVVPSLQSLDETDSNMGMIQTDLDDENAVIENTNDANEQFPQQEDFMDTVPTVKDVEETDCERMSIGRRSSSDNSNPEKFSFNSQVNELVVKLDVKCQSTNDMEADVEKFCPQPLCDPKISASASKIVNFEEEEKKSCEGVFKVEDNTESIVDVAHGGLNTDEDAMKVSQKTSFDINVSMLNSDYIVYSSLQPELRVNSEKNSDEFNGGEAILQYNKSSQDIAGIDEDPPRISHTEDVEYGEMLTPDDGKRGLKLSFTNHQTNKFDNKLLTMDLSSLDNFDADDNGVGNGSIPTSGYEFKTVESTESTSVHNVREIPKLSFRSQLNVIIPKLDPIVTEGEDVRQEESVPTTVGSEEKSAPSFNSELVMMSDSKMESSRDFKSRMNNLEMKLDESIVKIEEIIRDIREIKTVVPVHKDRCDNQEVCKNEKNNETVIIGYREMSALQLGERKIDSGSQKDEDKSEETNEQQYTSEMRIDDIMFEEKTCDDTTMELLKDVDHSQSPECTEIRLDKMSQTTETEVDLASIENSEKNEETRVIGSSEETITTLGFMVCYLLMVLSAQHQSLR